ncbi:MAG: archease [Polyangiaceae bacterium]
MSERWRTPQPYAEIDHTADAGVLVEGRTTRETLARLVLALGQLLAGEGAVDHERDVVVEVAAGPLDLVAVDVLRELLFRFDRDGVIPESCEVLRLSPTDGAQLHVGVGSFDPQRHGEGLEIKAVTLHDARFEPMDGGYQAQVIFDL